MLTAAFLLLAGFGSAGEGDWPLWRHDTRNSGAIHLKTGEGPPRRGWTQKVTVKVWSYEPGMSVWSSAAVGLVAGRPVVAAGSHDHNLYVFDARTGDRLWRYTTGNGVYEAPLIWRDGESSWVFAASSDRSVYGLDARNGARRWSQSVESYVPTLGGARLSAPALGRVRGLEAVFVGSWVFDKSLTHHLQRGGVSALDARTGAPLWTTPFLDNRVSAPLYATVDGRGVLFVASEDGNLRALDADTGRVEWFHRETEPIKGAPAFLETPEGPRVIIGSNFGKVRSLDARSGAETWSFKSGYWVTAAPAVFTLDGRDWVGVGSYDQRFYVLDARTGERRWSLPTAGPVYSSAAVARQEVETILVFGALDHRLYGASASDGGPRFTFFIGEPVWQAVGLGESQWSSPVVAEIDGSWMIYFGSYSGSFFGIPLNQAALGGSTPWSNLRFWLTLGLSMTAVFALALWLNRRSRLERGHRP